MRELGVPKDRRLAASALVREWTQVVVPTKRRMEELRLLMNPA